MKLYDFDGMFDKKLTEYLSENAGKYKESELEDVIPKLYKKFGDTVIKPLGVSPNAYYAAMDDKTLVKTLSAHVRQGVPVSEFLCNAIESRSAVKLLIPLLSASEEEREYAINLLGAADEALPLYMQMLTDPASSEDLKNRCVDLIKEKADAVKESALSYYEEGVEREYMLEILSRTVIKDDRIFDILLKEFRADVDNIPMHASYLAAYGDERALPYLLEKIDEEGISFIEYQELKFAIESLGGEYEKERDFSDDEYYQIVKGHSADAIDLFSTFINPKKT